MITTSHAKAFKGLEFSQPLGRLTLFLGPNGAGKTARTEAIMLAVLGHVPNVAKKNADIMAAFGDGEKLFVGIETSDKRHFLRRFNAREDGTVSQDYMVDRRKATAKDYNQAIAPVKVFDLSAWNDLSDQKKIDMIFSLYPPAGDIGKIDGRITDLEEKRNALAANIRALEEAAARLQQATVKLELPAGTLAEMTARIEEAQADLDAAIEQQGQLREEEARRKGEEEARKNLEESSARPTDDHAKLQAQMPQYKAYQETLAGIVHQQPISQPPSAPAVREEISSCAASLRRVLETMQHTGCETCTAALVLKREIKKLEAPHA